MFVFFFKQKTAYEMRISDWSSDVCSSDLTHACFAIQRHAANPVLSCRAAGLSVRPSPDRAAGGLGGARQRPDVHAGAADRGGAGNGDHDGWRHGTGHAREDRKSTTSELQSLMRISYAVFCLKKKTHIQQTINITV